MSHFSRLRTRIADQSALLKALGDVGFKKVEAHQEAQHLYGYRGDVRAQTAEVIVRRKYIGRASNDIGFKKGDDGVYHAIISDFDKRTYSQAWLNRLTQRYAYHVTRAKLEEQGFTLVNEEAKQGEPIHLVLRRVS